MPEWGVAAILIGVSWVILAGIPGAPVKGTNRYWLAAGGLAIILGYYLLSQGPWDNPASLTWAPILLVVGYVVLIPVALLKRQVPAEESSDTPAKPAKKKR